MKVKPGVEPDAEFSVDGRCRWSLKRTWDKTLGRVLFTGLNPSKAGKDVDDMTVVKGQGFARLWGLGGTMHGNAFPFIATRPADLAKCTDDEIKRNDFELLTMAQQADLVVVAWGSFPKFESRFRDVLRLLAPFNPICLGRTKDGFPKHISRIGYDTPREPWITVAGRT